MKRIIQFFKDLMPFYCSRCGLILSANGETVYYKWVKASDELSDDMKSVCIKYSNSGERFYRTAFYNRNKNRYENSNIAKWDISEVEWLKEIKLPEDSRIQKAIEERDKEIERLSNIIADYDTKETGSRIDKAISFCNDKIDNTKNELAKGWRDETFVTALIQRKTDFEEMKQYLESLNNQTSN